MTEPQNRGLSERKLRIRVPGGRSDRVLELMEPDSAPGQRGRESQIMRDYHSFPQ